MRTLVSSFKGFWITGDPKRRSRCMAFTTCLMAAYGLIFSSFGGQSRKDIAHEALIIGAMIMMFASFTAPRKTSSAKSNALRNAVIIVASVFAIFLMGRASFAVQGRLAIRSLAEISEGESSKSELEKTVRLLPLAANSGIVLPQPVLNAAYRRLVSTNAAEAWKTCLAIISYHSSFIPSPVPLKHPPFRLIDPLFKLDLHLAGTPPGARVGGRLPGDLLHTYGDDIPIESAARLEPIGSDANSARRLGPQVIVINVGDIGLRLDGMWMKKVVVTHSRVLYSGGPVKLEQVSFVDCEFQMEDNPLARKLGEGVLAGLPVSLEPNGNPQGVASSGLNGAAVDRGDFGPKSALSALWAMRLILTKLGGGGGSCSALGL